jgi:hypothetical protein
MEDPQKLSINSFKIIRDFVIEIHYRDGKTQMVDFGKIQLNGWWEELKDINYFKKVRINEIQNLEWPNGQDFKPEHLYYWEKYEKHYTKKS